ncbi:MAG: glycoside hydrolase N-terminal domain-containing protein [Planctomycetaceae bacterium]|jgi:alpha-L-fucosidase 2|nr:glycoside hydrolase N-terminal domain-containing protein [Planctomycetaceae bacterium]
MKMIETMKRVLLVLCCWAVVVTAFAQVADESEYLTDLRKELQTKHPKNKLVNIVFRGHSVPSGYFSTPEVRSLQAFPHLVFQAVKEEYLYARVNSIVAALGDGNAEDGAKYFKEEVLMYNPDVVFIDYALNDRWLGLERTRKGWESMIEEALAANVKVILMTPTPDKSENILDENARLAQHSQQIRELAAKYHVGLVDSYAAFVEIARKGEKIETYMSHINHPNEKGHQVVCDLIMRWLIEKKDAVNQVPMQWRYDKPATKYWEGLPIGTGRFAAMIPGALGHEVIAFNDETLYTGGPYNPNRPEGPEVLKQIRKLIFAHDYVKAHELGWKLNGYSLNEQFYQPMGRLNLDYTGHDLSKAKAYERTLDMDNATVDVSYRLGDVNYSRRVFASYPDQAIVIRLTADRKGKINFSGWLTSLQPSAKTRVEGNEIIMEGTTISDMPGKAHPQDFGGKWTVFPPQMKWQSKVRIVREGGTLTTDGDKLTVTDADAVTLILAAATNWVNWNDVSADEKKRCGDYVANAGNYSYRELLKRHLDDYRPLFAACKLNLGADPFADPFPSLTTTQAMDSIRKGLVDPAYEARYFQYGRYLLLAGARENTLAFNNHNIWLDNLEGRWMGRWTLNINTEVCYWPVENTNLPKVNESLLLFVENLSQAGKRTAKELFACRGWCSCLGTDIWFNTAPSAGNPLHSLFPLSGAWLMQQLYEHYLYDPDPEYLKRIYPLLKGATEFVLDFMVKDPESGYLGTCPASSPENYFIDDKGNKAALSFASAGDIQIVRMLLRSYVDAAGTLRTDDELSCQAASALTQLPPHKIGRHGQLQEWFYDFKEAEVTHRHMMHLLAAYPFDDITLRKTPELAEAVKVVLKRRGGHQIGWSDAWKISLRARLEQPDEAYDMLHQRLTHGSAQAEDSRITPSFEGNQAIQGFSAGMAEMLMQSHSGEISLLPALPKQWPNGAVSGFRARGGFDLDMEWKAGVLAQAVIKANYDKPCRLRTKTPVKVVAAGKEIACKRSGENLIEFEAKKGESYTILPR